ncbi:MAG: alpha-1,2-fucosyltransferase [Lachnospiraceae bacterium]|nr:alpha-1,2-fucosyltransferase [Lachnospiraceae bacterium]
MIIIKVNGGLGNQLQQYALYDKMKSLGKEVKLDFSWFQKDMGKASRRKIELDYFPGISYEEASKEEIRKLMGNRNIVAKGLEKLHLKSSPTYVEHQMYDPGIFDLDNKIFEGYWACEGYYADRISNLQEQLEFPSKIGDRNERMEEKMQNCNSVSIHIRRGDYLTEDNRKMFGGICTEEYYEAAMKKIREEVENPKFFIFSDDPEYCRKNYSADEFTVVDINRGSDSYLDIYLMSQCKHNICANSTFSFWGARLNQNKEKLMIRPLKQKNCDWYVPEKMKELWKGWILIDESGKYYEGR